MNTPLATAPRALVMALACLGTSLASAETLIGLTTTNALTRFDSAMPGAASAPVGITGLANANERIIGIDIRPSTGQLYGLSDAQGLYMLNATTGAATFVALLMADPTDATMRTGTAGVPAMACGPESSRYRRSRSSGGSVAVHGSPAC